jgi:hypothetical protein
MAGIKTENLVITVSGDAKVTPKGQKVENEAFVQKALEAMRAMNGSAIEYAPESQAPAMTLPTGTVVLKSEGVGGAANRVVVTVGVYVDGRRYNSRTITLVPGAGTVQIKAGAMVKVIYRSNDVAITLTGRARRSGMTGETIEVQTDSGATVIGVVVDAGTVEVKL